MRPVRYKSSRSGYLGYGGCWALSAIIMYVFLKDQAENYDGFLSAIHPTYSFVFIGIPLIGMLYWLWRAFHAGNFYIEISAIGLTDTRYFRSVIPWQNVRNIRHHKPLISSKNDYERITLEINKVYLDAVTNEMPSKLFNSISSNGWISFNLDRPNSYDSLEEILGYMTAYSEFASELNGESTR